MSSEREDRYWADYRRITLPMIGLLLLLALVWFWASSLLGTGEDDPAIAATTPTPATERGITSAPATPSSTPSPTSTPPPTSPPTPARVPIQNVTGTGQDTSVAPAPTSADAPDVAPTPDGQDRKPGTGFAVGTIVVTTDDGVRLRRGPSTDTEVVQELGPKGTVELRVTGAGQRDGQELWYPVTDVATGASGYVRGDLLQRSE